MNIFRYIDKYGNISFLEKEFNDVDNLIFSALIYIDLDKYVSNNNFNKRSIQDVGNDFLKNYNKKKKIVIATKIGIKVLRYIKDTKRYKDLLLYNYSYIGNDKEQFSAITIEINNSLIYVSFEGTDQLISGWKEDFMMSYQFPVLSQKMAIKYMNKFIFNRHKIIIGGHSKGGNLAVVAGMYANMFVKNKIIKVYNNDGPGLREEQFNSNKYKNMEKKLVSIIPNYSVVGLLLKHSDKYMVVKSMKRGINAHNFTNWVIYDDKLLITKLSNYSKIINKTVNKWLDKYSDSERELFVKELFLIFDRANIYSLTDINDNKKLIFNIIKETKGIDIKTKNMIMDFIYLLFSLFKEETTNGIGNFIHNKLSVNINSNKA